MISDEELLKLDSQGIIPGPDETEEDYLVRASYCFNLKEHLDACLGKAFPFEKEKPTQENLDLPFYEFSPNWIPLYYSDYKLAFWHGGCAWIFQVDEDSPTAALLQLRQSFKNSNKRKNLIAHELAHAGRMKFEEPKFEEFLAYQTSTSSFQRKLGPLIQSSKESIFFLLLLIMILILDLSLIFHPTAFIWAQSLKLIPFVLIILSFFRLYKRHHQYKQCLKNLTPAFIYRLTDKEISLFSTMTLDDIKTYIKNLDSLRGRLLALMICKI